MAEDEIEEEETVDEETFSVVQFFKDGSNERIAESISLIGATYKFRNYINTVGARIGTTVRVIITDGGDSTVAEWIFGKGITYPEAAAGKRY